MKEALLYEKMADEQARCAVCAHRCTVRPGRRGICEVRENRGGTFYSLVHGLAISQAVDPVEKKPLFHFHPGSTAYSVAAVGCNFRCVFCQNAEISQLPREHGRIMGRDSPPASLVAGAKRYGCQSIAYTYTEPTVWFEYTYDTAVLARQAGIGNVYVTNGYMTAEVLDAFRAAGDERGSLLDAANVDLKAFRDGFYRRQCGARLQPVLDSLKRMKGQRVWVEVTTLVIPGLNDSEEEFRDISQFIAQELGPETPWHISRFHPTYKLTDRPRTPTKTLHRAREIGLEAGLRYVYEGNVPGSDGESTYCYDCGRVVIRRYGFTSTTKDVRNGKCSHCGATIDGIGL